MLAEPVEANVRRSTSLMVLVVVDRSVRLSDVWRMLAGVMSVYSELLAPLPRLVRGQAPLSARATPSSRAARATAAATAGTMSRLKTLGMMYSSLNSS